jgi:hypothetical protein
MATKADTLNNKVSALERSRKPGKGEGMQPANPNAKLTLWTGRVLSALVILFLLFDGIMKLIRFGPYVKTTVELGYPASLVPWIGILLLGCTAVYIIPRSRFLGAILLTAFLGGATATLVRAGEPFVFPVILGMLLWAGLLLRDDGRLRELVSWQK